MHLTDTAIRKLKPHRSRREVSVDGCVGLYVFVYSTRTKSFVYKYRYRGKLQKLTLGQYPYLSLHDARAQATDLTRRRKQGEDIRMKSSKETSICGLATTYLSYLKQKGKKTWKEDERILNKDFLPRFGDRPADELNKRELIMMLDEIAVDRGAGFMANRTLSCVRSFFRWAACEDLIDADPSSGIRKRAREYSRDRSLSEQEIRQLWFQLERGPLSAEMIIALKLILLTGKRTTEIIHGQWSEISDGWWETPSDKSKTGTMHRTPLHSLSESLLNNIKMITGHSAWLFPSPCKEGPIRVDSVCRAVDRLRTCMAIPHWTSRDLRRTAATHMGRLGVQTHIIGRILNHSDGTITATYNRHEYDDEKYNALRRWDQEVARIITDDSQALKAA